MEEFGALVILRMIPTFQQQQCMMEWSKMERLKRFTLKCALASLGIRDQLEIQ